MKETWKPIPGFPGYEVSDQGQVRSIDRYVVYSNWLKRFYKGVILKGRYGGPKGEYRSIALCKNGQRYDKTVHTIVLTVFIGPCPKGLECCHKDGNSRNNKLENLRWDTKSSNQQDRIRHGTDAFGEKNPRAKLTEADVRLIRRLYNEGEDSATQLAVEFGVTNSHIHNIVNRNIWKHI